MTSIETTSISGVANSFKDLHVVTLKIHTAEGIFSHELILNKNFAGPFQSATFYSAYVRRLSCSV